ncbi:MULTISPECIES: glycoside hydrolase family 43 protein [unclassified Azospirillum]|uniref:glycoside hydrolase family 43 protein n=1 Tax=unclassified Azospirillum TaxID=2630922 RepID=UPI000B6CA9AF|nr:MULTISPECIES: glycoside hydrolase family 43 protein [unclassified Azospirillum]SNT19832.1 alpha-N-arabinofuranosidase [Azospirillum sp. RU38E]SNT31800.1 alpha-N-arabinofuranosidase [Azospirillum sp. RU37A]
MGPAHWASSLLLSLALSCALPARANEARFAWVEYQGADPVDAVATPGPQQFRNPILAGFYPDPSITRVGADYYLVTSTFAWFPGIPVFHSRDLVSWTQIGNAIDRPTMLDFGDLRLSRGVFAPAIAHHAGIFYIINTCVDCGGNFIITAKNPAGPWSDPIWLPDLKDGIDPSLFFDDDGRAYIVNNGPPVGVPRYDGHRAIWIQAFDTKTLKTFGPRTLLVDGGVDIRQKPVWIEGPHIFKKDGFYYLTAAEGGTAVNHSQVVFRAGAATGPFQPGPDNPFLTQRDLPADRPYPVTSAGHADLVETQDGDWWAPFLAVRPYHGNAYNTGRETFLLPVRWVNGWPQMTRPGEAIDLTPARPALPPQPAAAVPTSGPFSIRDDFTGTVLPPYWMTPRNPKGDGYDLTSHPGSLTLRLKPVGLSDRGNPAFWARRQQHMNASVTTAVTFMPQRQGERAGLAAMQNDDFWYRFTIEKATDGRVVKVASRSGKADPADGRLLALLPVAAEGPLRLRITARGGRYDFAVAAADGPWRPVLTDADGTILSTAAAGGFVGTMIGPFAEVASGGD